MKIQERVERALLGEDVTSADGRHTAAAAVLLAVADHLHIDIDELDDLQLRLIVQRHPLDPEYRFVSEWKRVP